MKNNYVTRFMLVSLSVLILIVAFFGPCDQSYGKCIGGNSILVTRTLVHIFLSILITSLLLSFISDIVFRKWIRFAIIWFLLDVIFIAIAPEYSGYYFGGPTKELVSIWMGALFVIISLMMFVVLTIKEKKSIAK